MSRVLADSSVWIRMFREGDAAPETNLLGRLLRDGFVCTNGLIRAELLSGVRTKDQFRGLEDLLSAVPNLEDPPGQWDSVAAARFWLARRGFQASIADLLVAVSAGHHRKALLTLDRAFLEIQGAVKFELVDIPGH